ncbi:MAG TPA: cytochrome c oxidase subunit II [Pyrinomonadaceae bacterium]|jgi:Heme/copper-type cytochrome/quinol oxidases, subunit 2|nr:cytochrome c oxidase subunit II [Pyrinomonadaceae bacterium]
MGRALAVIIWIITALSVLMFVSKKWWFPAAISEHGPALDRQFLITIIVVGISFAAAQIGLGWMVWKYRDTGKAGDRGLYTHGSNRLEIIWTVVTAVVFISLGIMGQSVWASLRLHDAPAGSYTVEVVAQQFQWNFHYPGKDNVFGKTDPKLIDDGSLNFVGLDESDPNAKDDSVITALAIPVNKPVELRLRSKDVIHSFWVPPLRFKQDLVPGMEIKVHFTATKVGQYELACAELCGQLHFKMRSFMLVLPDDEMDSLKGLPQAQFQARIKELLAKYPITID